MLYCLTKEVSFLPVVSYDVLEMLSVYLVFGIQKNHYSRIILPICGVPAETCSFLVFPLLVHLSCVTVYCSGCPAVHGGVWLGSRFLRAFGRHPLWLPARLMSLCLVLGVILNYCGTEFPVSLRLYSIACWGSETFWNLCFIAWFFVLFVLICLENQKQ